MESKYVVGQRVLIDIAKCKALHCLIFETTCTRYNSEFLPGLLLKWSDCMKSASPEDI